MATGIAHFTIGHFPCVAINDREGGNISVLLVTTDQHRVLIDTGRPELLFERLGAVGVAPADIDVVVLTHADFDHIGGAVDERGERTFPRARYVLSRDEWAFWATRPERLRPNPAYSEDFRRIGRELPLERLAQLRDTLELVDTGAEIVPGVRVQGAPGHTPGVLVVEVASGGERLRFVADLVYNPADIADPDWFSIYDFDPQQAVATRQSVLGQAAEDGALLMATHAPFPGLGRVERDGHGWRWHPFTPIEPAAAGD